MKRRILKYHVAMIITAVVFSSFFTACKNAAAVEKVAAPKKEITVAVKDTTTITVVNDSTQVKINIANFLRWYKLNYAKANSFEILKKDNAGNFMVDKPAYIMYLNFLSSSGLVSPRYIGYWQSFFSSKQAELKKNKIKSDVPDGFDNDFVLITQEPELALNKIDSIKFVLESINDSAAIVSLTMPRAAGEAYQFEMYKSTHGWQIGYISSPDYD